MDGHRPPHEVRDNHEARRFELVVDDRVIGVLDYRDSGEHVTLPHTEITPDRRGQGWGEVIVREALDVLRTRGKRIVPQCWFVADFLELHPDYKSLVV